MSTTVSGFATLREDLQTAVLAGYDAQIARMSWDRARIRAHQRERLRALLGRAAADSPFHARRLAGVDLAAVGPEDLTALPVMTREDLMGSFDDVVTDRRVTLARAEAALATAGPDPAVLGDALVFTSGGSAGRRGVFLVDRPAAVQFLGSISRSLVARLRALGGAPPGGAPPGGVPIALLGAGSPVHPSGAAPALTAGGRMPMRYLPVPVTLPLDEIVARLEALRPPLLYGYPTVLARLAAEQRAGRLHLAPLTVITTSETCTPELRAAIREGFGAPVVDGFASTEGLVGTSAPDDPVLTFAEDGAVVELVDADDRPVPPGTPSHSVLVTVLENHLQPLIRYRLTDSMTALPPDPGHGHLRARVRGRTDEVLVLDGVALHPHVVRTVLAAHPAVLEHRIRQTPGGIAVDIVVGDVVVGDDPGGVDLAALRAGLAAALAGAGLPGATVTVVPVPALPRDPHTGKARRVVPLG
ncbi:MAG: hypothetical protein NTW05_00130 [Pseudonocardiales bacterium]|nr:hypothetical protein [Pseudonocardiales bacterium]